MVPSRAPPQQGFASTSGYTNPYFVQYSTSTGYVTGGITLNLDTSWVSNWNGSGYTIEEVAWRPVRARNRKERRLLDSGHLPSNAVKMAEIVYGRRGERYKLDHWDRLFFKFWMHLTPKHRTTWDAPRAHALERYTSPLRRFAGGKLIVRKP